MRRRWLAALRAADAGGDSCILLAAADGLSARERERIRAAAAAAESARTAAERAAADGLAAALTARARLLCRVARACWLAELFLAAEDHRERGWPLRLSLILDLRPEVADLRPYVLANGADASRLRIAASLRLALRAGRGAAEN